MVKNRTLVWIAAALLALGAGLSVALVTLPTPVASQRGNQASGTPGVTGADAVQKDAIQQDAVQKALLAGKPTVVEFGANACASCREMKVILDDLRRTDGERITIVDVDLIAQREADYIRRYRIQLMPTQVFFDAQGRETSRHMGKISAGEILARLELPAQTGGPQ